MKNFFESWPWIWSRRIFALSGLIALAYALVYVHTLMTGNFEYELSERFNTRGIIYRTGVENIEGYDFILGEVYRHPFMDDYSLEFCFSTENHSIREASKKHWMPLNSALMPPWLSRHMNIYEITSECFGPESNRNLWTATLIDFRVQEKENRIWVHGFEILFYDPTTKRFAFYGHQI